MSQLSQVFTSPAMIRVLEVLWRQSSALALRQIALLAHAPVYSVQRALQQLQQRRLVTRAVVGQATCFSLQRSHPHYALLDGVFVAEQRYQLRVQSGRLGARVPALLTFLRTAAGVVRCARAAVAATR